MPVETLEPRYQPAVAVINQQEVAILGGWSKQGFSRLGDIIIFNSRTNKCKKVEVDEEEA